MKANKINYITEYIQGIANHLEDVEPQEIIDALTGICWDEEDASYLIKYFKEETEVKFEGYEEIAIKNAVEGSKYHAYWDDEGICEEATELLKIRSGDYPFKMEFEGESEWAYSNWCSKIYRKL